MDTVFARFTIDFPNKPGHTMDLGFAADSLKAINPDHILARKAADLEKLRELAALHHLDLIKIVLQSYGGKATLDQIYQVLVPDVIRDDWKKWWEQAKRELKKDGHFLIPGKKTEPIVYQAKEVLLDDRVVLEFRTAKGLKAKVAAVTETIKSVPDLQNKEAIAAEFVSALNADIATHQRTQPGVALEAIFIRDDLRAAVGASAQPGELCARDVWAQNQKSLGTILEQTPASKHRRILQAFKESNPESWHEVVLSLLNTLPAKICTECANMLVHEHRLEPLKEVLGRLISQHSANTELLLWLARERSDAYADILGPEVFRAMLTAMERDQFNEKRSNRLHDFVLSDETLLVELIGSADLEVIKDLTRALQLSPCFDDMDKRSLLGRIVKSYPAVQSLISGEQTKQEAPLLVSWESLERRRAEYTELVQRKIPANSREIAIARSYGDLRENHEYKAAKEMQKLLMKRKGELEHMLVHARGTDFANARTDVVAIGTIVNVTEVGEPRHETFTILGAWDSNPEQGVISYLSPLAQVLIGHKVGEEVEADLEHGHKRLRLDSIEAFNKGTPAPLPPVAGPAAPVPPAAPEATAPLPDSPVSASPAPPAVPVPGPESAPAPAPVTADDPPHHT